MLTLSDFVKDYKSLKTEASFEEDKNVEYESKGDRNKILLPKGYLEEIISYLKDITIMNNVKRSNNTWKI